MPHPPKGPPPKRAKLVSQIPDLFTFTNAHDIEQALHPTQDQNVLSKGLFALRSKLSVKPSEVVAPHDERLSLAKLWMVSSPAAEGLFDIWGAVSEMSIQALVTSLFSTLLSLFSCHLPDHMHGISIIKTVLSPQWLRRLNSTLKLFHTISTFGSGRERKSVFEAFPWDNKNLPKLLHMRRRGKESERGDILDRPGCTIVYQDSVPGSNGAKVFTSIFKGLVQDHYTLVQKVLLVCWEGVWSDPKIKRTAKLGLFNELTVSHLLKLYDRAAAESSGGEQVPADIVHHFLLAICTHPGQGICFRDRGWYPRETDDGGDIDQDDIQDTRQKDGYAGKIHNKILANVLRVLKVNEDPRQQELALRITAACPELVAGYWSAASLTLEPRLSSKWIANIAFAGQVISQPIPVASFHLSGSDELYNPTPPPLSIIMGNLLPSVGTKTLFTKGLQAASTAIVQHCTALVLAKCLRKLADVVRVFETLEAALEEDEEEGQWSRRRREVEKEARRRVPEFQVIVAFSQQTSASTYTTKHALLSESAQRLLGLYQECLPDVVAEARFEVGKLVLNLVEGSLASLSGDHEDGLKEPEGQRKEASTALQSVKHLHVLRLLSGSDQFAWGGKVASSSHTYFYVLLKTFCNSRVRALRTTVKELLQHVLSESVLFQEDPNEVETWLGALPFHFVRRGQGTEAPDGAPLTDEVESVVSFLDDCTQRCLKTPYRYMESMSTFIQSSKPENHRGEFASPLLMTVLEQVLAKWSCLQPSKSTSGYHSLLAILDQLDGSLAAGQPFPDHPSICFGMRRELSIARACLRHFQGDCCQCAMQEPSEGTIATFLDRIEQMPIPPSESARMTSAFELVDWVRLVDVKPSASDISRLAAVVRRFYEPAIWALINYLHPSDGHLWESDILKDFHDWPSTVDTFGWLYFHSSLPQLQDRQTRAILLMALYAQPVTLIRLEYAICLITHGVAVALGRDDLTSALLFLLADILARARDSLSGKDVRRLKATVIQSDTIQGLCVSHKLAVKVNEEPRHVRPWVSFMGTEQLLDAIEIIQTSYRGTMIIDVIEDILGTLQSRSQGSIPRISTQVLIRLHASLPQSYLVEDMLSAVLASQLPSGLDGQIVFVEGQSLSTLLSGTKLPHQSDLRSLPSNLISRFLEKEFWIDSTGNVIITLLYSDPASLQAYVTWLNSKTWTRLVGVHTFASTLAAFLECTGLTGGNLSQVDDDILVGLLDQLFPGEGRHGCSHTRSFDGLFDTLSDDAGDSEDSIMAAALVAQTPLKPIVVNRLLQNVLQHRDFVSICGKHASRSQRNRITRLLEALFWLHPANTCQPSHVEPLFQVYGGTMSAPDRRLLSIMRLFEEEKRISLSTFFSRWSPSTDATVSDALEVVQNFDPIYMLRTCLAFPLWRRFGKEKGARDGPADDSMLGQDVPE
ncbi:ribosome 60S biogenesis N-terminal-domain-containing protein [Chiua virens]|nr:ribosome 60S biogenesis N-terminal-domain-containing protein [Chiua virens]